MTQEQYQNFLALLTEGLVPDDRLSDQRQFLRGWNEGIAYAERMARRARGESEVVLGEGCVRS